MMNTVSTIQRILVIDDTQGNLDILREVLSYHNFDVLLSKEGHLALQVVIEQPNIDLILLDIMMPNMDGFEVCQRLKANPITAEIPVIFMTALSDTSEKVRGFALGAVDYIIKPVQEAELLARLNTHLQLHRLKRQFSEHNRELQHTLTRQRAVLDSTPSGIAFLSADRYFLEINQQVAFMFGYSKDSLINQSTQHLYNTAYDFESLGKEAYPILLEGKTYESERLMKRKDGSRFWCRLRGKLLKPKDTSQGSVWNLEDITERKRVEDDLRLAGKVFETMSDAILVSNPSNATIMVNPAFTEITGYSEAEILEKNPSMLSSGRHDRLFYRQMWETLLSNDQWQGEVWNRRKNGSVYPIWLKIKVVRRPDQGISHYVSVFCDITERKQSEAHLQYQANYDRLTGLANRAMFHSQLQTAILQAKQQEEQLAVFYIDLDGFKQVNDQLGHEAGDQVLITVAQRLAKTIREGDVAARLGGDEFAIILSQLEQKEHIHAVVRRILNTLALKVEAHANTLDVSASVGIAIFPDDAKDEVSLLRAADQAMYRAKLMGKNTFYQITNQSNLLEDNKTHIKISQLPTKTARILYAEDNEIHGVLVQSALENVGYQVEVQETGQACLNSLQDRQFELILIDYQLPDIDGMTLLQHIQQLRLKIPVIFVTAQDEINIAVAAMKQGAVDYVRKDTNFIELLPSIVTRTLESGRLAELQREAHDARRQQALYRTIFDSSFVSFFIMSLEGRIIDINATACQLFGYVYSDLIGIYGKSLLHPYYYNLFSDFLNIEQEFPLAEAHAISKNGGLIFIELHRSIISYQEQPHLLATLRDISERKQVEQRLHQAAILFEHSADGVIIADAEYCIIAVNQAFTELTGYYETEALGKPFNFLNTSDNTLNVWERLAETGVWRGEAKKIRKNTETFISWEEINSVVDINGQVHHYISIFSDITERKQSEEKIHHLSHYDLLTNLPNRLLLNQHLMRLISKKQIKQKNSLISFLFIGLDRFKQINDSLGYQMGDRLLQATSERLTQSTQGEFMVVRLGGDEFALLQEQCESPQDAAHLATQLLNSFNQPFHLDGHELYVTFSIGISLYPQDGKDISDLLKQAHTAMSRAKEHGGNSYQFYSQELTYIAQLRLQLENDLRHALNIGDQLFLVYQPQIDLETSAIIGAEALVRWQHPSKGIILPDQFIPMAEETGLILPLGEWVLRTACQQICTWQAQGLNLIHVAVNLSALQLKRSNIVVLITDILDELKLQPSSLELEITETLLMQEIERTSPVLNELRQLGVKLAIDDFGTGYSSLSYLKKLPVDKLKLDRSFLPNQETDQDNGEIAAAMIALGRSLKLRVISEGVEHEAHESFLKLHGCHEAQGFFYSRPVTADAFEAQLKQYS